VTDLTQKILSLDLEAALELNNANAEGNGEFTPEQRRQSLPIPTKKP
jgi:hypothetical protein